MELTEQARRANERSYAVLAELLPRIGAHLSGASTDQSLNDLKRDYVRTMQEFLSAAIVLNDRVWLAYATLIAYRSLAGQGFEKLDDADAKGEGKQALEWALDEVCWPHVVDRAQLESEVISSGAAPTKPWGNLEAAIEDIETFLLSQLPMIQVGNVILREPAFRQEFPIAEKLQPHYEQLLQRLTHEKAAIEKLGALLE